MVTIITINADKLQGNGYLLTYLSELKECSERLIICVSKNAGPDLLSELRSFSDEIYEYDTYIDVCRWSDVLLNRIDRDYLKTRDVLLTNDSVIGPFTKLSDILDEMGKKDVDFWGITAHGAMSLRDYNVKEDYCERFIQTYFLVLRSRLLNDDDFYLFLEKQKSIKSFEQAALSFEFSFTSLFESKGYKWSVYVDTKDLESDNPDYFLSFILFNLYELVKTRNLPFIPKVVFDIDNNMMQTFSYGGDLGDTLKYIKESGIYDTDLIYDHILNNMNLYDMITRLNINYVLPDGRASDTQDIRQKTAVFAYVYYEDLFDYCLTKLSQLPEGIDVFIATDTEEKKRIIEETVSKNGGDHRYKVLLHNIKGRDISALLITFRPYITDYEVIGFLHDKKSMQLAYPTIGAAFNNSLWENMLFNTEYADNILSLFKDDKRLGMLVPPMITYGTYFHTSIDLWTVNYENTKKVADMLGVDIITDPEKNPVALGSVFWCRRAALKKIFEHDFSIDDFPDEPLGPDGTFNHALERVFPYVAQAEGYYTGVIMNNEFAALRCNNNSNALNGILRELKKYPFANLTTLNDTVMSLKKNAPRKKRRSLIGRKR